MAASQISTSVTIISSGLLGWQAISLDPLGDASVTTVIKSGSKVEIASAFFTFDSDTTPGATSWTAISTGATAYITLTPSGTAGSQVLTADWSSTAPTWSTSKQAWYASAASTVRYVGVATKGGASSWTSISVLPARNDETMLASVIFSDVVTCTSTLSIVRNIDGSGSVASVLRAPLTSFAKRISSGPTTRGGIYNSLVGAFATVSSSYVKATGLIDFEGAKYHVYAAQKPGNDVYIYCINLTTYADGAIICASGDSLSVTSAIVCVG